MHHYFQRGFQKFGCSRAGEHFHNYLLLLKYNIVFIIGLCFCMQQNTSRKTIHQAISESPYQLCCPSFSSCLSYSHLFFSHRTGFPSLSSSSWRCPSHCILPLIIIIILNIFFNLIFLINHHRMSIYQKITEPQQKRNQNPFQQTWWQDWGPVSPFLVLPIYKKVPNLLIGKGLRYLFILLILFLFVYFVILLW